MFRKCSLAVVLPLIVLLVSSCSEQSEQLKELYRSNEAKFEDLSSQIVVNHNNSCDYISPDEVTTEWLEHDKLYICVSSGNITAIVISETENPMLTYIADPDGSRYGTGQEFVVGRLWFECEHRYSENWYLCKFSAN